MKRFGINFVVSLPIAGSSTRIQKEITRAIPKAINVLPIAPPTAKIPLALTVAMSPPMALKLAAASLTHF